MRLILRVDNNSICHATHKTKILFVQQIPPPLPLHAVSLTVITSCSVARSSPHTATSTPVCPYHEIREIRDRFVFLEPSEVMRELCLPKKRKNRHPECSGNGGFVQRTESVFVSSYSSISCSPRSTSSCENTRCSYTYTLVLLIILLILKRYSFFIRSKPLIPFNFSHLMVPQKRFTV